MADHDAHDHTGVPGAGTPTEILDIPTAETDDTLVLAPDGAGGVEFRAEAAGASAVGFLPWLYPVGLYGLVAFSTNDDLPANGGSLLVPFFLPGPMKLHGVSVRCLLYTSDAADE